MAAKKVTSIHKRDESKTKSEKLIRWIVPRVPGPAWQHAMLTTSQYTICRGHATEGAIYPPSDGVPKCPVCCDGVALMRANAVVERQVTDCLSGEDLALHAEVLYGIKPDPAETDEEVRERCLAKIQSISPVIKGEGNGDPNAG